MNQNTIMQQHAVLSRTCDYISMKMKKYDHVFSKGKHGLSLADEAWANEEFGEPYTLEQTFSLGQAVNDGTFPVPEEAKQALNEMAKMFTGQTKREKEQENEEVKQWPELADEWIMATL